MPSPGKGGESHRGGGGGAEAGPFLLPSGAPTPPWAFEDHKGAETGSRSGSNRSTLPEPGWEPTVGMPLPVPGLTPSLGVP